MANLPNEVEEWWSANAAAERTRLNPETIRKWAREGLIQRRSIPWGRRVRYEYPSTDVLRESAARGYKADAVTSPVSMSEPSQDVTRLMTEIEELRSEAALLRDRNTSLEEVARRYRYIDEKRDEIEKEHREIEVLLQGPASLPNN